jgi:hypothetical protein
VKVREVELITLKRIERGRERRLEEKEVEGKKRGRSRGGEDQKFINF